MGTTLVAACVHAGGFAWLSVGDSFLFHCRERADSTHQPPAHRRGPNSTQRARRGEITEAEAAADPDRALITSVVMGLPLEEVASGSMRLEPDDLVILASDGVETLGEDGIASVCGATDRSRRARNRGRDHSPHRRGRVPESGQRHGREWSGSRQPEAFAYASRTRTGFTR